jgi:hypothetical protein
MMSEGYAANAELKSVYYLEDIPSMARMIRMPVMQMYSV